MILKDRLENRCAYKAFLNDLQLSKNKNKPKDTLKGLIEKFCLVNTSISHTYTSTLDRSVYYTGICFDYRQFIIIKGFPEGPP